MNSRIRPGHATRDSHRSPRTGATALQILVIVATRIAVASTLTVSGCSSSSNPTAAPAPALAGNAEAQRQFRRLSQAWHTRRPEERNQLEGELRAFVQRYPVDDQTRLARTYLAWILIQKGELVEARRLIEKTRRGPTGTARDFSRVVESALLIEHGQPLEAIRILRQLQGKIIDPVERFLATEQLVIAALDANLYSEAMAYMVDWIEQANPRDRSAIRESIASRLRHMPQQYVERALDSLEPKTDDPDRTRNPQRYAHKVWLYQAVSKQLAHDALRDKDAQLAARVVDKNPSLAVGPESAELLRLAAGGEPPATIAGRTVGLLLSTSDETARRRSNEIATGFTATIGYVGDTLGSLQLTFEEETENPLDALAELSARGAALLVAGVTPSSARAAARYAERTRAPVLLLNPGEFESKYVFEVGVSVEQERRALADAFAKTGGGSLLPIDGDPTRCLPSALTTAPFPVAQWVQDGVGGLLFVAGPACVGPVIEQCLARDYHPWVGLGLDAQSTSTQYSNSAVLSAGRFPLGDADVPGLATFERQFGRKPTWFETLGRDVAQIALEVLSPLPEVRLDDAEKVSTYHGRIRQALIQYQSDELWSSTSARFGPDHKLIRKLTVNPR